jgi:predicted nucleotidyltransferase
MASKSVQMTDEQIAEIAKAYGEKLQGVFDSVELRLFGSYFKHTANPGSDLDLAVVSRDFAGMEPYTAMKILNRMKLQVNNIIEPIPLTPQELKHPEVGTIAYSVAQGSQLLFKAPY